MRSKEERPPSDGRPENNCDTLTLPGHGDTVNTVTETTAQEINALHTELCGLARISLSAIIHDEGTQSRVEISQDTVSDYAQRMAAGDTFPPIVVFHDGNHYFLADGFHRVLSAERIGSTQISADVRKGTKLDAIRYSIGANRSNRLRRTNADKRRCVEMALEHFADQSDNRIADMTGTSQPFVSSIRKQLITVINSTKLQAKTREGRDGKNYPAPEVKPPQSQDNAAKPQNQKHERLPKYIPENGMMYAETAVEQLKKIQPLDKQREDAFRMVGEYCYRILNPAASGGSDSTSDSENLGMMKRYWKRMNKKDRRAFLEWVKGEEAQ